MIGNTVGHYQVVAKLGEGGMGDVYRAHDARLNRDVAVKVLPDAFTHDAERLARFRREAELLASLSHPNIAAIYGLEDANGAHAIVMELVDGGTLADRLNVHGALPPDDALAVARQIADALEAAHDKGIIHRDLKPGNVALTRDGQVKVLDFGLAKALAPDVTSGAPHASQSPTITSPAMTELGIILGTAAYMAPEQAKGRPADKRSDVWAFGCVLYEMLAGRRAFDGEDVSDTLAAVLRGEPDWTALPAGLPASVRELLRRCLEKDRRRRVGDLAAALFAFDEASATPAPVSTPSARPGRERLLWLAGLVAAAALAGTAVFFLARPSVAPSGAVRFSVFPPADTTITSVAAGVLSPDGRHVVFHVTRASGPGVVLAIRSLDTLESRILAGTEGTVGMPFWSPDSRFIGFHAEGKLKKVDVNGGPPQVLCDAQSLNGATWNQDGIILFAPSPTGGLFRVPQSGGEPVGVTTLDAATEERSHRYPWFLPDGRHFLYVAQAPLKIYVGSLDSADRTELLSADSRALYADGHLLYVREGTLLAQPFDVTSRAVTGDPFPLAEGVLSNPATAFTAVSASVNGALAFRTGLASQPSTLVWFDRTGKRLGAVGEPTDQMNPALSPDGRRVAASVLDSDRNTRDIAIYDLSRDGLRTRFTFDPADEWSLVWSPDGARLAFNSNRKDNQLDVYVKASSGAGAEELLLDDPRNNVYPSSWSPDGQFMLFNNGNANSPSGNDVWALPLGGDGRSPLPIAQSTSNETGGRFSPDGRWIAFASNEFGGGSDVFVVPFLAPDEITGPAAQPPVHSGKWQVSTAGGLSPRWRGDGKEVFYISPDNFLMAAEVAGDGTAFQVGAVRRLFQVQLRTAAWLGYGVGVNYDVSADGQRFLVNTIDDDPAQTPITVVLNWTAAFRN